MKSNVKVLVKTIFLFLALCGFGAVSAQAQSNADFSAVAFDPANLSESGSKAYQDLLQTKVFTLAGFGVAAADYRATIALANLIKEKNAEKALQSVVRNANPEGQIYGLLGLQVIKSKAFTADLAVFKRISSENSASSISSEDGGCDSQSISLARADVIKDLESGKFAQRFEYKFGINQK